LDLTTAPITAVIALASAGGVVLTGSYPAAFGVLAAGTLLAAGAAVAVL
jgi:hypothetical protein